MKKAPIILSILFLIFRSLSAQQYETYSSDLLDLTFDFWSGSDLRSSKSSQLCSFAAIFDESEQVVDRKLFTASWKTDALGINSLNGFHIQNLEKNRLLQSNIYAKDNFTASQWESYTSYLYQGPSQQFQGPGFDVIVPMVLDRELGKKTYIWLVDSAVVIELRVNQIFNPNIFFEVDSTQDYQLLFAQEAKSVLASIVYRQVQLQFEWGAKDSLTQIRFSPLADNISPSPQIETWRLPRVEVRRQNQAQQHKYDTFVGDSIAVRFQYRNDNGFQYREEEVWENRKGRTAVVGLMMEYDTIEINIMRTSNATYPLSDGRLLAAVYTVNSPKRGKSPLPIEIEKEDWKFFLPENLYNHDGSLGLGNAFAIRTADYVYIIKISGGIPSDVPHFLNSLCIEGRQLNFEYNDDYKLRRISTSTF